MIKFSAEKLTLILTKRGMSFKHLSKLTGISENALRAIRYGEAKPRTTTIYKIATALGVDVEELIEVGDET